MSKKLNKISKISSSVLVALVIVLALLLVGVRLFGLQVYTVLSPSMEPEYPTGSLIYIKEIDPAELEVNDVITFKISSGMTATHRIIELVPGEDSDIVRFRTKGDANDVVDGSLVKQDDVIGTPVFMIPLLGYLATYIQQPPGSYIAITVSVALIILVIMVDIATDDKKQDVMKKMKKTNSN